MMIMPKDITHAEGYASEHDVYMFTQMFLSELSEIYWFRGENEANKGNEGRAAYYVKKYHEVHNCKRELSMMESEKSSLVPLKK